MPDEFTVREWVLDNHDGFAVPYARARDLQIEHWSDEILEIADDGSNDWMERLEKGNAGWQFNGENVQRSRLRSDNRKWLLVLRRIQMVQPTPISSCPDLIRASMEPAPAERTSVDGWVKPGHDGEPFVGVYALAKLRPDKYGDRITATHTSAPGAPVITRIEHVIVDPKKKIEYPVSAAASGSPRA